MTIHFGSDKIKRVYNGSQSIGYVYNGSQLVWKHNPYPVGTVIANTRTNGSFVIYPGTYELKIAGAGGTGSGTNGYWVTHYGSGGSGAAWEGTFRISANEELTFSWTTGTGAGASVAVSINGTRQLNAGGGGNSATTGTSHAGGAAGVITVDSAFSSRIVSTSLSSNGTVGESTSTSWGTTTTSVTAAVSTLGWGAGANSANSGRTEGGLYIKRTA